ncbi:MAG: FAD-dependent monooxygenase [bacterium]|nr:FAD-dependent monooxygenase [Gammaproteobacteria bacterium]
MDSADVVIVGGGIGGCTLGAKLADSGLSVLILERETDFYDRVRGEWMAPWGVKELMNLDLYDLTMQAGGHHITRNIGYDELLSPEDAESSEMPLNLVAGVDGPLTIQHVTLQNIILNHAIESGCVVKRGVNKVEISPGENPEVSYLHDGQASTCECRLIVGADGRTSVVRRQIGLKLEEDPIDHLIAGLLIDDAHDWPADLQSIGKVGDIHYLIFPQGDGKVRLYVDYDLADRSRFAGESGAAEMLKAFDMACVPNSKAIANATPIGPCRSNPSQDAWVDNPWVQGVVLIGDAAGYNDPILGQGLSVTLRDARMVAEILSQQHQWSTEIFLPYGHERKERLRRLRLTAQFATQMNARFGKEAEATRARARKRINENPELQMILLAAFMGPEAIDARYFEPGFQESLFA